LRNKIKILIFALVFLTGSIVLLQWKAKQIVFESLKANTSGRIEVKLGRLKIIPFENTIDLRDISIRVNDPDSGTQADYLVKKMFIDVVSLWDFFSGGTLVIDKLQCEGGDIILHARPTQYKDTVYHKPQSIASIIKQVKSSAVRFKIKEITFSDVNLTLLDEDSKPLTEVKHFHFIARNLHLNPDSILRIKPLIEFSLPKQAIQLPSRITIAFDTLFFSSSDNSIQLQKLKLKSEESSSNQFNIQSEKIRLAHFNFEQFYSEGIATIDSVFLDRSHLEVKRRQEGKDTTMTSSWLNSALPFHIRHLIINKLEASLKLSKGANENSFTIGNSTFTAEDFRHQPDSIHKLSTKKFDLVVKEYNTFLGQRSTSISFDTVRLQNHSLALFNFKIASPNQKLPLLQTVLFQLNEVDWYSLLFNNKLIAEELLIKSPTVRSSIKPADASNGQTSNSLARNLEDFIEVKLITMENATAFLQLEEQKTAIEVRGGNATFDFADLIKSSGPNEALKSIDRISFVAIIVNSPDFSSRIKKLDIHKGSLQVKNVFLQAKEKLSLNSGDFKVEKINWDQSLNKLNLNGVGWKFLDLDIPDSRVKRETNKPKKLPVISIENLLGENSRISYATRERQLRTILPHIKLKYIEIGETVHFNGVDIKGLNTQVNFSGQTGSIASFEFRDQGAELNDIVMNRQAADTMLLNIKKITIEADLQQLAKKKFMVKQVALTDIKIDYSKFDSLKNFKLYTENNLVVNDFNYSGKDVTIASLYLEAGPVDLNHNKKVSLIDSSNGFKIHKLKKPKSSVTNNPLSSTKNMHVQSKKGGLNLSLANITAHKLDSTMELKATINSLNLKDFKISTNDLVAQITSGAIHDMKINSSHLNKPMEVIRDNQSTLNIKDLKAKLEIGGNLVQFNKMEYDPVKRQGMIKDFEFRPIKDKQSFLDESFYQTNFIDTKIASLTFNKLDVERLLSDSAIHLTSIHISEPNLDIHKDKTRPFFPGKIKLLPTNAIQKIGMKIKIDTVQFEKGKIRYTEKSRITGKEGSIFFSDLNGRVRNIKTTGISVTDSLYIRASTRFLDSARVNLRVRESYHDTLGGFLITTNVSPFHTSILNQSLVPMASVKFEAGFIDTLQMRAIGREYVSLGSLKMLYHDLKVDFLNKEDTSKHSVKNVILKFAANNFVIKATNTNRVGKVYFERDRHRAVFQYWIKMILSGVTTSVGAKSNKKQIKKYMKQLNQKKLPPINQELIDL
jgi:hypothetical protein